MSDSGKYAQFGDPFHPETGRFRENTRDTEAARDGELRELMTEFGWLKELPAIRDERGVLITGHRRRRIAAELGIPEPWPEVTITFGDGDEADAHRMRLAMVSNLGGAPLTREDKAALAAYLYGERKWAMARIADSLGVSTSQVSHYLTDVDKPVDRGGRGNQKGDPAQLAAMEIEVRRRVAAGEPVSREKLAAKFGVSEMSIRAAVRAARDPAATVTALADAPPPPRCLQCRELTDTEGRHRATGLTECWTAPDEGQVVPPRDAEPLPAPPDAIDRGGTPGPGAQPQLAPEPVLAGSRTGGKTELPPRPAVQPPSAGNLPHAPARTGEPLTEVNGWAWDETELVWTVQRGPVTITVSLPQDMPPDQPAHLFGVHLL